MATKSYNSFLDRLRKSKRTQLVVGLIVLSIVFLVGLVLYFLYFTEQPENEEPSLIVDESQRGTYRILDGIATTSDAVNQVPFSVMVENLVSVRPQSGLSSAGVVYEALAEGGITRFMAVYAGGEEERIGPVRSARSYFVDLASEYGGLYAHAGGSPDALAQLSDAPVVSLNQVGGDHAYFWRDSNLFAPHNLFSSSELLFFALRDFDVVSEDVNYEGWKFVDAETPERDVQLISIDFSTQDYLVSYEYDSDQDVYIRTNGGELHLDEATGEPLAPTNVLVQFVSQEVIDGEGRLSVDVNGSGDAVLFRNGRVIEGRWEWDSEKNRTMFYDTNDELFTFSRGQTFVELVPEGNDVTY